MHVLAQSAFDAWKRARAEAHAAEKRVQAYSESRRLSDADTLPPPDLVAEADRLRMEAKQKLTAAMRLIA